MTLGRIHSFETFGSVDGPGVRFVVFMQGCKMRCRYCHNPDTWSLTDGELLSAQTVFEKALRYRDYWGKNGGITVSGGEPLLQMPFVTELFTLAKKEGIHTTIDTAGGPFTSNPTFMRDLKDLLAVTDLIMLDLKHLDSTTHKRLTGTDNAPILAFARYLSDCRQPMWIRHVLVPGWSDEDEHLTALSAFIESLNGVERVEVLPFHNHAKFKWESLGIKYTFADMKPPTSQSINRAKVILKAL